MQEGEFFVIEAEAIEDGRLEAVNMDGKFDNVNAATSGGAAAEGGLNPAADHPDRAGLWMAVPGQGASEGGVGLDHGDAPELPAPNNHSLVE